MWLKSHMFIVRAQSITKLINKSLTIALLTRDLMTAYTYTYVCIHQVAG